jgi:VWFA-related protein
MKRIFGLSALACTVSLCALPILAQQGTPADPPSVFGEELDVRVVNVEVVVTNRKGGRVTDLKPEDFRLLVDRQPVSVEYFTEVREGQALAAPAAAGAPEAPREPGAQAGTSYLVFIDDFFAVAAQRDDVLKSLRKDLSRLGPQDRMAVVAWDGGRLKRLTGWSQSPQVLAEALDQAMRRPARGLVGRRDLERLAEDNGTQLAAQSDSGVVETEDPTLLGVLGPAPGVSLAEVAYAEVLSRQIAGISSAVVSAMRGAGSPEGRKVLLLLSGGWPLSLQEYVGGGDRPSMTRDLPDPEPSLRSMTDTANLLGYTVYPVDVPGVMTAPWRSAVQAPSGTSVIAGQTGGLAVGSSGQGVPGLGSMREQEIEATLNYIARQTGGKAMLNGNRMLALARTDEDVRSYYSLGFTPAWRRDGKSHRVEVEVLRPGLKTRSRTGFVDLSRGAETAMKVQTALLFGDVPEGEPLTVRLGAPSPVRKKGAREFPVSLEIPVSALTVLPIDGKYVARIELRLAAADSRGNLSDSPAVAIEISSATPPAEGQRMRYDTQLFLFGKAKHLVAVVYDRTSGKIAAGQADFAAK